MNSEFESISYIGMDDFERDALSLLNPENINHFHFMKGLLEEYAFSIKSGFLYMPIELHCDAEYIKENIYAFFKFGLSKEDNILIIRYCGYDYN